MIPTVLPVSSSSSTLDGKPLEPGVLVMVAAGTTAGGAGAAVGGRVVVVTTAMLVTTTEYVPAPALCATALEIAAVKTVASADPRVALTFAGLLAPPPAGVTPGIVIT